VELGDVLAATRFHTTTVAWMDGQLTLWNWAMFWRRRASTQQPKAQAMAQRFPGDYNGILSGAPAIHFEKLGLG
jgi:hypothetical protein